LDGGLVVTTRSGGSSLIWSRGTPLVFRILVRVDHRGVGELCEQARVPVEVRCKLAGQEGLVVELAIVTERRRLFACVGAALLLCWNRRKGELHARVKEVPELVFSGSPRCSPAVRGVILH
jgi:hypothetical protein